MERALLSGPGLAGETIVWEAEASPDGLLIKKGREGKKPRTQRIPVKQCLEGEPGRELAKRRADLLAKGYTDLEPPVESEHERRLRKVEGYYTESPPDWF